MATAGRKPTTTEGRLRATARSLRSHNGDMRASDRLAVMHALLGQADTSTRWSGQPDLSGLIRLAAHALVWAEQIEEREPE